VQDGAYGGMLVADSRAVSAWVMSSKFEAQLNCLFPFGDATKDSGFSVDDAIGKHEAAVEEQCMHAFQLVQQFESTHGLNLQNMGANYLQRRSSLVDKLTEQVSSQLTLACRSQAQGTHGLHQRSPIAQLAGHIALSCLVAGCARVHCVRTS
jgi:hypothetical protein